MPTWVPRTAAYSASADTTVTASDVDTSGGAIGLPATGSDILGQAWTGATPLAGYTVPLNPPCVPTSPFAVRVRLTVTAISVDGDPEDDGAGFFVVADGTPSQALTPIIASPGAPDGDVLAPLGGNLIVGRGFGVAMSSSDTQGDDGVITAVFTVPAGETSLSVGVVVLADTAPHSIMVSGLAVDIDTDSVVCLPEPTCCPEDLSSVRHDIVCIEGATTRQTGWLITRTNPDGTIRPVGSAAAGDSYFVTQNTAGLLVEVDVSTITSWTIGECVLPHIPATGYQYVTALGTPLAPPIVDSREIGIFNRTPSDMICTWLGTIGGGQLFIPAYGHTVLSLTSAPDEQTIVSTAYTSGAYTTGPIVLSNGELVESHKN